MRLVTSIWIIVAAIVLASCDYFGSAVMNQVPVPIHSVYRWYITNVDLTLQAFPDFPKLDPTKSYGARASARVENNSVYISVLASAGAVGAPLDVRVVVPDIISNSIKVYDAFDNRLIGTIKTNQQQVEGSL